MKNNTKVLILVIGLFSLYIWAAHSKTFLASTLAFTSFFAVPRKENRVNANVNISSDEENNIRKTADNVYEDYTLWRKLVKIANLLSVKKQELIANNPEFEESSFKSQTKKTEKQFQMILWPLGALAVDFFLIKDAFTDELGIMQGSIIPIWLIIACIALIILGLEIAIASFLDNNMKAKGNLKENKLKYVFIFIIPMIAAYSFINDYVNNGGGYGVIFFFTALTLVSLFTHYIAIKNAGEFIALIGFQKVDGEISKLKKEFDPLAKKSIELEARIDRNLGSLYNAVCDYQQAHPESTTNFLRLIPADLRLYFNSLMGNESMPLPAGYIPSNGSWSRSLFDELARGKDSFELLNTQPTIASTGANAGNDTDARNNENQNNLDEETATNNPFNEFFSGEKRV